MYKVLIVDDHAVVRRGLQQIIADESDHWESGEAGNATQAWSSTINTLYIFP